MAASLPLRGIAWGCGEGHLLFLPTLPTLLRFGCSMGRVMKGGGSGNGGEGALWRDGVRPCMRLLLDTMRGFKSCGEGTLIYALGGSHREGWEVVFF